MQMLGKNTYTLLLLSSKRQKNAGNRNQGYKLELYTLARRVLPGKLHGDKILK